MLSVDVLLSLVPAPLLSTAVSSEAVLSLIVAVEVVSSEVLLEVPSEGELSAAAGVVASEGTCQHVENGV